MTDGRQWPEAMAKTMSGRAGRAEQDIARDYQAKDNRGQPTGLTLEKLKLDHGGNLYFAAAGQGLFNWGVGWKPHRRYSSLDEVRKELKLEEGSELGDPGFVDCLMRDFRVPANSPAIRMKAYPQGDVPDVRLGVVDGSGDRATKR